MSDSCDGFAVELAKSLEPKDLKAMQQQKNFVVVDCKGKTTLAANEAAVTRIEAAFPDAAIKDYQEIVRAFDAQLLHAVSALQPGNKVMYEQWVRNNAKWARGRAASDSSGGSRGSRADLF